MSYPVEPIGTVNVPYVLILLNVLFCIVGAVVANEIISVRLSSQY